MDSRFFGSATNEVRAILFEYVSKKKIPRCFKDESKLAGRDCLGGSLKRYPEMSLRRTEPLSLNRVFGIDQ